MIHEAKSTGKTANGIEAQCAKQCGRNNGDTEQPNDRRNIFNQKLMPPTPLLPLNEKPNIIALACICDTRVCVTRVMLQQYDRYGQLVRAPG
jgi:hypothetical protein